MFSSNLLFATIDQTLSSFLLAPYGLRRGQANMNAAAIAASYLVFDEFHLYDPISTLPTTLHMLRTLKGITPFVLMTATFSAALLDGLADLLDAEVLPSTDAERDAMRTLESQQKTRRYNVSEQPFTAARVLDTHTGRSLVICNTVHRARRMYDTLSQATEGTDTSVVLLHSQFLRADRDRIENGVRAQFGKGAARDGSMIVVATQAIEVGVDITCTQLHTELAPANAILQRAGRCARYPGDEGDVTIYPRVPGDEPGETVDLTERVAPYMQQEDEFTRTLSVFCDYDGATIDFSDEQAVVSFVHGPRDQQMLDQLHADSFGYRQRMFAVMRGDKESAQNLIRDVKQQRVTIHADPDALLEAPFDVPSFGLHPGTVQKCAALWLERYHAADESIPWALKWLKVSEDETAGQGNRITYSWEPVFDAARAVWGAPLVVVHPALATYTNTLGFVPDRGGMWQAEVPPRAERPARERFTYRLETYERHVDLVYAAAFNPVDGFWQEMTWLARRLEQRYGWAAGSVRRAAELAVLLHDVGKLSAAWQGWVRDYQAKIDMPVSAGQAYAHTELQDDAHCEIERAMRRRPWHAVEGAIATAPVAIAEFGNAHPLSRAVFSAIARHHAPYSDSNQSFRLVKDALLHVKATMQDDNVVQIIGLDGEIPADAGAVDIIADPEFNAPAFVAYELLVRVLRRADQLGTSLGTGGAI